MIKIDINSIDANLAADINGAAGYEAYEADYDGATVSNQCYHIVHNTEDHRGGIVFVGSGSNGETHWTDAATPEEVLSRFLADDMRP